jgi:hypothetical protein
VPVRSRPIALLSPFMAAEERLHKQEALKIRDER